VAADLHPGTRRPSCAAPVGAGSARAAAPLWGLPPTGPRGRPTHAPCPAARAQPHTPGPIPGVGPSRATPRPTQAANRGHRRAESRGRARRCAV
jgi:hypothetical protein